MIPLRFYGTGMVLQVIGDSHVVDVATVSRVVTAVTDCIFDMKDSAIKFPTADRHRHRMHQDGTYIRIQTPFENEEQYVNRKHFHNLNMQASCDNRVN
ncbi:hypothetical protein MAR_022442, partial [Mya arenaria]